MNKREHLMRQIQELGFACLDLNLYLDTHPDCKEALIYYNRLCCQLDKATKMYEMHFGPLTNFGHSTSTYPWQWEEGPWPWEYQC
ncbi:spore coat protein CotJB [Vallitalea okinawensis]|uniref:spore coat protein CotJB n=1 Tax=Vallitalea okinawensis TaxID=2078660 RepID=UPI000CFB981D|nr:spore coat protein CotJB [Vallitalea okinawensis]